MPPPPAGNIPILLSVSGSSTDGRVGPITITSEAGSPCRIDSLSTREVKVIDRNGKAHLFRMDQGRFICFNTETGKRYEVAPVG